ncbi:hypothetical protein B0H14DRAFT_2648999 [Mycena olivaceomarginata]|nr:hypothetical protein B0H14DRAFT_2648999 [Mycena olivaceomarginata]
MLARRAHCGQRRQSFTYWWTLVAVFLLREGADCTDPSAIDEPSPAVYPAGPQLEEGEKSHPFDGIHVGRGFNDACAPQRPHCPSRHPSRLHRWPKYSPNRLQQ